MKKNLGLYIHIPFCISKCAYCDFLSFPVDYKSQQKDSVSRDVVIQYVRALEKEIKSYQRIEFEPYQVNTIYVGGGTPSILAGKEIESIFQGLRKHFAIVKDAEISVEVNPGTVTRERLKIWKAVGINRLSIGLQSTNDEELKILGRAHTFQQFHETFAIVRESGFDNVSVDLISGIPGQRLAGFTRTLEEIGRYSPEHISVYGLIIEEGTPFGELYGDKLIDGGLKELEHLALPGEDIDWEMYKQTEEILTSFGYHRYEISNYAKAGFACKHNIKYWEREEYLGIGLGAASLLGEKRLRNITDIGMYFQRICENQSVREDGETETLTPKEQMEEFLFLGLRQIEGVSKAKFQRYFGKDMEVVYKEAISKLVGMGLLIVERDNVRLTRRGIDVSNSVFVEFISYRT